MFKLIQHGQSEVFSFTHENSLAVVVIVLQNEPQLFFNIFFSFNVAKRGRERIGFGIKWTKGAFFLFLQDI